ncbi:hypothetical protein Mal33_32020 [Rosistilla oblonga]|uniref:Uncharacterized protein n=1 Tax=Rosistilla oblonga TaxID=2527990 RepID=A0A518IVU0_9BACT|nr:hypothetical protein Mal33_32020 [Rosistilla oblonga]
MGTRLNEESRDSQLPSFNRVGNAPRVHAKQKRNPKKTSHRSPNACHTRTRGPMGTRLNESVPATIPIV